MLSISQLTEGASGSGPQPNDRRNPKRPRLSDQDDVTPPCTGPSRLLTQMATGNAHHIGSHAQLSAIQFSTASRAHGSTTTSFLPSSQSSCFGVSERSLAAQNAFGVHALTQGGLSQPPELNPAPSLSQVSITQCDFPRPTRSDAASFTYQYPVYDPNAHSHAANPTCVAPILQQSDLANVHPGGSLTPSFPPQTTLFGFQPRSQSPVIDVSISDHVTSAQTGISTGFDDGNRRVQTVCFGMVSSWVSLLHISSLTE